MAEEMERTSAKNKIHVSEATAELLRQAGKIRWLHPRESKIFLKGKGDVQTYYISPKDGRSTNGSSSNTDETEREDHLHSEDEMNALRRQNNALLGVLGTQGQRTQVVKLPPKIQRLVDWNANVLLRLLKKIEGYRQATSAIKEHVRDRQHFAGPDATVLDEVQEVVKLPKPSTSNQLINVDLDEVELSPEVVRQLHLLVVKIASMYHNNAFHNFEHAR